MINGKTFHLKQRLEQHLHSMFDDVNQRKQNFGNGFTWNAMTPFSTKSKGDNDRTLYAGSAGVLLFLLHYYRCYPSNQALEVLEGGIQCLIKRLEKAPLGFINNASYSTVFLLLEALEAGVGSKPDILAYLEKVIANDQTRSFQGQGGDYLTGIPGTLLVYLHLHARLRHSQARAIATKLLRAFLENVEVTEHGCVFHSGPRMIQPLSGLGHGTSGMALALLEYADYFQDPAVLAIAKSALNHELKSFSSIFGNWPDFRANYMVSSTQAAVMDVLALCGETRPLRAFGDAMDAFCHGNAGIGLVLARAYQITGDLRYRHFFEHSCHFTAKTMYAVSLDNEIQKPQEYCHGLVGNAELFLVAQAQFQTNTYRRFARSAVLKLLAIHSKFGRFTQLQSSDPEPLALFLGRLGVGYFFLRYLYPHKVSSIILPTVNRPMELLSEKNCSKVFVTRQVLKAHFAETWQQCDNLKASLETSCGTSSLPSINLERMRQIQASCSQQKSLEADPQAAFLLAVDHLKSTFQTKIRHYPLLYLNEGRRLQQAKDFTQANNRRPFLLLLGRSLPTHLKTVPIPTEKPEGYPKMAVEMPKQLLFFFVENLRYRYILLNPLLKFLLQELAEPKTFGSLTSALSDTMGQPLEELENALGKTVENLLRIGFVRLL